jgi:hypothetical protein
MAAKKSIPRSKSKPPAKSSTKAPARKAGKKTGTKKPSAKKRPPTKKRSGRALAPGTKVTWQASQGTVRGTVKKKITSPMKIKGHAVSASPENPEYLVESAKTGAQAAHKANALRKE